MFVKERIIISHFNSVAQSCLTLCDPMNCSTPGFSVHHQLPEFTQTHVHRVGDAIQPSHPLSSPFPPAPNIYCFYLCFGFLAPRHVGSSLPVRGWTLTFCTGSEVLATELPGKSLASAYSLIDLLCWSLCDPLNIYVQAPWWHRVNAQYSFGVTYRWMWLYERIISKI